MMVMVIRYQKTLSSMVLAPSVIYTTCVVGYKVVKQYRIRIISNKSVSEGLYNYVNEIEGKFDSF